MNDGVAWVGMRVAYNAKATRRMGIIPRGREKAKGTIVAIDTKNHLGGQCVDVEWDDGEKYGLSPDWLCRIEWAKGGYRHGKRKDEDHD